MALGHGRREVAHGTAGRRQRVKGRAREREKAFQVVPSVICCFWYEPTSYRQSQLQAPTIQIQLPFKIPTYEHIGLLGTHRNRTQQPLCSCLSEESCCGHSGTVGSVPTLVISCQRGYFSFLIWETFLPNNLRNIFIIDQYEKENHIGNFHW